MTWDHAPESPASPTRQGGTPPLFAALQWALQHQWRGHIAYETGDGSRGTIQVADGRVTGVECDDLAPARLLDLMRRAGILEDRQVARLERYTRKTGMDPVSAALETGMISRATLAALREATAREALLRLLLERDLRANPVQQESPGFPGRDLSLPLPFLLKEAHRRHQEAPAIRQVVTGPDQVFVRTGAGRNPDLRRWEDIQVSPAERQIFFFVDGRRSVEDLALATCQSIHEVGRGLAALHAAGLVQSLTPREAARRRTRDPGTSAGRSSLLRLAAMTLALALAIVGLRGASQMTPPAPRGTDDFHLLLRQASDLRVQAAGCLFRMREGRPPADFEELLDHRLVVPGDRRAATMRDVLQEAR